MRRPKPREITNHYTMRGPAKGRCTRAQPSVRRATRSVARVEPLTGIAHVRPAEVQPLRSLRDWARSIFDAAREMVEEQSELVET